jgi:calcineurin-like phosphoesterase family protein
MDWMDESTWIISDTHFGHANISKLCDRPPNVDRLMAKLWHEEVRPTDHVLHLGDVGWKGQRIPYLPGVVHYIGGNHDRRKDHEMLAAKGWERISDLVRWKLVMFSHYPLADSQWGTSTRTNIHGHIHNNGWPENLMLRDRRNVSVEVIGYRPVRLGQVLRGQVGQMQ